MSGPKRFLPQTAALAFSLLLTVSPSVLGQEWTRFRGPNGSGESEAATIPERWTEDDYNWKTPLPGVGHSSPVVWGQRVFLLSADPQDATRYVLCIDAETGKTVWQRSFASTAHRIHSFNTFASSTPTVDQDRVYVTWATPDETTVIAFDHLGNTVWEKDLGPFVGQHGFGTSPVRYKDLLILASQQQGQKLDEGQQTPGESHLFAFDCQTGKIRWKLRRESDRVAYSTPFVFRPDHGLEQLICCTTAHGIYSVDPMAGKENWSLQVFDKRVVSSPNLAAGLIFGSTGSGGGGNYVTAVRPGNPPEEVYRIKTQAPYVPTSVARGDLVFLWYDRGIVTCIHAPDGEVIWRHRVGGDFMASPIRVADRLYGVSLDGEVVVLAADREFQLLARNQLGESTRSTPAVSGGRMYLRTESHLMSIGGPANP